MKLLYKCGPEKGPHLALDEEGSVYKKETGDWERFDFNAMYDGYYPACIFTALNWAGNAYWLGGIDERGLPQLFTSLRGGVWMLRNTTMQNPMDGAVPAIGKILRILWDTRYAQAHLVMSSGQLITLPDCPSCVRVRQITNREVLNGCLDSRDIILTLREGGEERVSLDDLASYRAAWSWAQPQIRDGAPLIDLREPAEYADGSLPGSVNLPPAKAWAWLLQRPKDESIFFLCNRGMKADLLVRQARENGYTHAYSLGGTDALSHVE